MVRIKYFVVFFPISSLMFVLQKRNITCIIIYFNLLYFYFLLNRVNQLIYFNKNFTCLIIKDLNNSINKPSIDKFNTFLLNWNFYFFKKIKISGKGYRLHKTKNGMLLLLNFSNITFFRNKTFYIRKLGKHKFMFFMNEHGSKKMFFAIRDLRYINPFTKKGIKIYRAAYITKRGKISLK